jgi:NRPS condensation-like uncharacterized protein
MISSGALPATMPVEFVECTVYVSCESGFFWPQLGGVVALDARLDDARLRHALRLLLDAEPVLGCRFDADAKTPVWRRLEGLDDVLLVDVRQSDNPAHDAAAFVAEPFDLNGGPQVLAALVRGPSADTLAVKASHVAVDGGALKETLYLISEFYRRLGEQPDWTPLPNLDGVRQPMAQGGLGERLRALRQSNMDFTPPSDWDVPSRGERGPGTYVSGSVEPEVFRSAVARGKSAGATVNDLLLTAYYRALYEALDAAPGSRTPLLMGCELRKHLPGGTTTALSNISASWIVSVPPVQGEEFDGTLARVVEATQEWKRAGAGRAISLTLPTVNRLMGRRALGFFRGQFSKTPRVTSGQGTGSAMGLTNIGVIDEGRLDFGSPVRVADAWLLGPVFHDVVTLTSSTFRDRFHLAIGAEFASLDERLVTNVVERTVAEIQRWAGSGTQVA